MREIKKWRPLEHCLPEESQLLEHDLDLQELLRVNLGLALLHILKHGVTLHKWVRAKLNYRKASLICVLNIIVLCL